ncbi:MAG: SNF2-related protein, partial [Shewanella sp.]
MLTTAMKHQAACINKLSTLKVGALFMEMGTGKTRCFLELGVKRIRTGKASRIVILAPVSGIQHLANEVTKHTCESVAIHDGRYTTSAQTVNIIGIESMSSSITALNKLDELVKDSVLIIDESHLIKNRESKRAERILRASYTARYRYVSTGMPMPRGIEDLWLPMQLLSSRVLGYSCYSEFRRMHLEHAGDELGKIGQGRIIGRHNVEAIAAKIAPYTFEARKADCLNLPDKTYSFRTVEIGDEAQMAYSEAKRRILMGKNAFEVDDATIFRLFTALQQISSGIRPNWLFEPGEYVDLASTKAKELRVILESLTGKTVVWCKYLSEVDAAEGAARQAGKTYQRIDGRIPVADRNQRIQRWREDDDILISTIQTGAMVNDWGFADYSIYMSNCFDYMLRMQSEDRTHRAMMTGKGHYIDIRANTGIERRIV